MAMYLELKDRSSNRSKDFSVADSKTYFIAEKVDEDLQSDCAGRTSSFGSISWILIVTFCCR